MREWTEQEEQEMIDRAKAGDPQANYEMSLWALQRAEEEPGETRWNKLAAKCLVKSAQAGYGPAQERMGALLLEQKSQAAPAEPESRPEPIRRAAPRQEASQRPSRQAASGGRESRRASRDREEAAPTVYDFDSDNGYDDEERPRTRAARSGAGRTGGGIQRIFANWTEAQWKRMEIICVAVCVVLAIVLAIMLFTGKGHKKEDDNADGFMPAANVTDAEGDVNSPGIGETGIYPDEAARSEIAGSDLEVKPEDSDYVAAPKGGTVNVSQTLRLRGGPDAAYALLAEMPNGTHLDIYAEKNDWALVKYDGTWGWCSEEYLTVDDAGAVG